RGRRRRSGGGRGVGARRRRVGGGALYRTRACTFLRTRSGLALDLGEAGTAPVPALVHLDLAEGLGQRHLLERVLDDLLDQLSLLVERLGDGLLDGVAGQVAPVRLGGIMRHDGLGWRALRGSARGQREGPQR